MAITVQHGYRYVQIIYFVRKKVISIYLIPIGTYLRQNINIRKIIVGVFSGFRESEIYGKL